MTWTKLFLFVAIGSALLAMSACKQKSNDASQPLTQSFEAAEPATKQAIQSVSTHLKSGNYTEAAKSLVPVLNQTSFTPDQKRAIGLALDQMNKAVQENPTLDTKEMYDLRQRMFRAVHNAKEF